MGEAERGLDGERGSWWGHGRERAFSWVWLNHRRCSSGLRDKSWQLVWTSGLQPWGPSFAFQLSLLSSAELVCSRGDRNGGTVAGGCHSLPWLPGQPCAHLAPAEPFFPGGGTRKKRLGVNAQLCKRTHRARVGRVSTGLGNTVLSDAC